MALTVSEKDFVGTIDDLALFCAISKNTAQDYASKGMFVAVSPGRYRLVKSCNNYIEGLRKAASGRGSPVESARAKLIQAQTKLAERKAGVLARELVPLKDVEAFWAALLRALRAAVLAIPSRVAGRVPGLALAALDAIDREIREALNELANNAPALVDDLEADGQRASAADAAESQPVDRGEYQTA
jgi:phage terminase Nu1 subunit (DNA packaging protein)